jgi:hypothetical protein
MDVFINTVSLINTFLNHICLDGALSTHILWLRACCNMSSGIQLYLSIYIYINKYCPKNKNQQIWIQTKSKQNKKIFLVFAEIVIRRWIFSHKLWVWREFWYAFVMRLSWGWGHTKFGICSHFWYKFGWSWSWVLFIMSLLAHP